MGLRSQAAVKRCALLLAAAVLLAPAAVHADGLLLSTVTLSATDRVLIIAPHPDDEVLGTGGVIQAAVAMKVPVRVVFMTNGDNNELSFSVYRNHPVLFPAAVRSMGEVRHDEAIAACRILGLKEEDLVFFGYPDFGLMPMFVAYWGVVTPFENMLTRVTAVPYRNAFRPGAAYRGDEILSDLKSAIKTFRPTKIFVSHPADENPDHRGAYLFTRVALWDLEPDLKPELWPYLVHFRYRSWPRPEGYFPEDALEPPIFFEGSVNWQHFPVDASRVVRKYKALQAHRTQFGYIGRYLSSFVRTNELFGDFSVLTATTIAEHPVVDTRREPPLTTPHPELTSEEKARFVGLEQRTIFLEGRDIVETITFTREIAYDALVSVYFLGYRRDIPFSTMPKIRITIGSRTEQVYNGKELNPGAGLVITRKGGVVTIRCPLRGLGYPEKVMTSARSYLDDVPLDWMSWRVIENLPQEPR